MSLSMGSSATLIGVCERWEKLGMVAAMKREIKLRHLMKTPPKYCRSPLLLTIFKNSEDKGDCFQEC